MDHAATPAPLAGLTSAFAEACRLARSEADLFERCRAALARHLATDAVWLTVATGADQRIELGPATRDNAVEVAAFATGTVRVAVMADAAVATQLRSAAGPLAFALTVLVELRSVLLERQQALEDAAFQLRALRQVSRLLASAHSVHHTEELILDFLAEVFQASQACLYRPAGAHYTLRLARTATDHAAATDVARAALDAVLPPGAPSHGTVGVAQGLFPAETQLAVPLDAGDERVAIITLGPRRGGQTYGRGEVDLAQTLAVAGAMSLRNAELFAELHSAATTDPLTGLMNRRALEERLREELQRGERHSLTTSVVLMDLDRFKAVNDTLGHDAGDRLLRTFAQVMRREARTLDVVGRLGGDEFIAILPMTTASEARIFAARVQQSLADLQASHPELGMVSVSLGIAQAPIHGRAPSVLLAAADLALYRAKHAGRNAIEVAGS